MNLIVHTDGGSRGNPGPAALGFVINDDAGQEIFKQGKYLGTLTNNQAEYMAVLEALKWLIENFGSGTLNNINAINIILDSELLVNQLTGKYKIKSPNLRLLADEAGRLQSQLNGTKIIYQHVRREKNKTADKMVNQALDQQLK